MCSGSVPSEEVGGADEAIETKERQVLLPLSS